MTAVAEDDEPLLVEPAEDGELVAYKIAGSMAFTQAMEAAQPVLLEPIGLSSRRGHPLGMESRAGATEIKQLVISVARSEEGVSA